MKAKDFQPPPLITMNSNVNNNSIEEERYHTTKHNKEDMSPKFKYSFK
jgi:hypothetical protein